MIERSSIGAFAELRIHHEKELNPFTRAMTRELIERCEEVERDDEVLGVLLWGGAGRSFSVGGDFHDLREVATPEEGAEVLRQIVRSYQAVLAVTKPVVVAVDRYAIGQGLQVALMGDWRVGTERSSYRMPELANGMPCPLGSTILEALLGRAAMLHWVVGCGALTAQEARAERLIDEVCADDRLRETALERLERLTSYPQLAYRRTKAIHNERMAARLDDVREAAARCHAESFFAGQADRHFSSIVGERDA